LTAARCPILRRKRRVLHGAGDRVSFVVDAAEQLDPPFRPIQQIVTPPQELDPLLVLSQRLV
jgi:hypothetical protein